MAASSDAARRPLCALLAHLQPSPPLQWDNNEIECHVRHSMAVGVPSGPGPAIQALDNAHPPRPAGLHQQLHGDVPAQGGLPVARLPLQWRAVPATRRRLALGEIAVGLPPEGACPCSPGPAVQPGFQVCAEQQGLRQGDIVQAGGCSRDRTCRKLRRRCPLPCAATPLRPPPAPARLTASWTRGRCTVPSISPAMPG